MLADIFGPDLLIVIIVIAVLLFGGAAIPRLARNLGSAKNQFEQGMKDGKAEGSADSGTSAASGTSPASDTFPAPPPAEKPSSGS